MDLDLVFLGTAASVPTPGRGLTSMLVRRGGERILIDCGEGTQRQMMRSCGLTDIDGILLTHLHADHVLGLPGMLKTFSLRERAIPLTIIGPRGTSALFKVFAPIIGRLCYELDVEEIDEGCVWSGDDYQIDAIPSDHSVRSNAYRLIEDDRPGHFDVATAQQLGVPSGPLFGRLQRGESVTLEDGTTVTPSQVLGEARRGRVVVYSGDTRPCAAVREAARDATVLIHEATFMAQDAARAVDTGHSTAYDAALLALAADVQMLALTHISTRYPVRELQAEARDIFPGTVIPRDLETIDIPYLERGVPTLVPRTRTTGAASSPSEAAPQAV